MSERTELDRMAEAYSLVCEQWGYVVPGPWAEQTEEYREGWRQDTLDELLPMLVRVGLDPDAIRAAEREACALAVEAEMPATQDMSSTNICEALERAASRIRASSASDGRGE